MVACWTTFRAIFASSIFIIHVLICLRAATSLGIIYNKWIFTFCACIPIRTFKATEDSLPTIQAFLIFEIKFNFALAFTFIIFNKTIGFIAFSTFVFLLAIKTTNHAFITLFILFIPTFDTNTNCLIFIENPMLICITAYAVCNIACCTTNRAFNTFITNLGVMFLAVANMSSLIQHPFSI